ncbi:MAG: hypothetical protein M1838_003047 [Thelocarpon superellum]|nr:MAG: hypothetical protein M1838_003047 [Thelocarpon superellum]
MEYTRLGNSGLKVSKVILGAMSYGSRSWQDWILEEEEALPLLEHAYKADIYSHGRSEEIIGKALTKYNIPRERVVILSKCYFPTNPEQAKHPDLAKSNTDELMINRQGLSRKHIFDAVDASVKRLGTYIDVLQIHRLDQETPKEEIMKALHDVVESGKVRYIGASSMAAWEFQALQNIADKHGWTKFISMQNFYNLVYREEEREMIPYCRATGIGLIPWSPLHRGILARPWNDRSSARAENDRIIDTIRKRETDVDKVIVDRVEEVAKKHDISMATVATAWCLSKEGVNPIIGLSSKERINQACEALQFKLSEEDVKYLEEPYQPKLVFGH